jgi:hypothetical protein
MTISGSCLCGGVAYEAEGPLVAMVRCHCTQCRKASGAEFATNGSVSADTFRILRGEELVSSYAWSPGNHRFFCSRCGSPLFKRHDARPDQVRLRLGTVDGALDQKPLAHVFVSEKPSWSDITDELPQHEKVPGK